MSKDTRTAIEVLGALNEICDLDALYDSQRFYGPSVTEWNSTVTRAKELLKEEDSRARQVSTDGQETC